MKICINSETVIMSTQVINLLYGESVADKQNQLQTTQTVMKERLAFSKYGSGFKLYIA